VNIEPQLYLPSDSHTHPFGLSFNPYPASPSNTTHGCTFTTVGVNTTISRLPPKSTVDPTSPDVLQIIVANTNTHLHMYKCLKLGRINKTNPTTSIVTCDDTLIGKLLDQIMLLILFAIDPLGRFGPLLHSLDTTLHRYLAS
jgi:hypothetical protein